MEKLPGKAPTKNCLKDNLIYKKLYQTQFMAYSDQEVLDAPAKTEEVRTGTKS